MCTRFYPKKEDVHTCTHYVDLEVCTELAVDTSIAMAHTNKRVPLRSDHIRRQGVLTPRILRKLIMKQSTQ
jgi:hypothetical protein